MEKFPSTVETFQDPIEVSGVEYDQHFDALVQKIDVDVDALEVGERKEVPVIVSRDVDGVITYEKKIIVLVVEESADGSKSVAVDAEATPDNVEDEAMRNWLTEA